MSGSHGVEILRPVLLDTGVFSRLLVPLSKRAAVTPEARRQREEWRNLLTGRALVVSAQTRAELLAWPLIRRWPAERAAQLERRISALGIVPLDDAVQRVYAELLAWSRFNGHGLQDRAHPADRWIAASAQAFDLELATEDRIFGGLPSVSLLSRR